MDEDDINGVPEYENVLVSLNDNTCNTSNNDGSLLDASPIVNVRSVFSPKSSDIHGKEGLSLVNIDKSFPENLLHESDICEVVLAPSSELGCENILPVDDFHNQVSVSPHLFTIGEEIENADTIKNERTFELYNSSLDQLLLEEKEKNSNSMMSESHKISPITIKTNSSIINPSTKSPQSFPILPGTTVSSTIVEQPNIGPCTCFICGQRLSDPLQQFTYFKSQKLLAMQITLLQLLGEIVNQRVMTNADSVELCPKCSEIINETDNTYKHLVDLKQEIIKLFSFNQRPKVTFQVLSPTQVDTSSNSHTLADLEYSRPRRGRKFRNKIGVDSFLNEVKVKKLGGRPRKPFQCKICRRKFHAQHSIDNHMVKEHDHPPKAQAKKPVDVVENSNVKDEDDNSHLLGKEKSLSPKITMVKEFDEMNKFVTLDDQTFLKNLLDKSISAPFKADLFNTPTSFNPPMLAGVRQIQPKPKTMVQKRRDGSLVFLIGPTLSNSSSTLIKMSENYLSLNSEHWGCEICGKTFNDERSYKMHRNAAHGARKRKNCDELSKEYSLVQVEKRVKKPYECKICNAIFASKKLALEHKKDAHSHLLENLMDDQIKDKPYTCEYCNESFEFKYKMKSHMDSHLTLNQVGPHEFMCSICGLKVASRGALKIHIHRFHTIEEESKEYLCSECGYMSSTKKGFSEHMRIHNDSPETRIQCLLCSKIMLPASLKIHMLRMHGEAKYSCEICDKRFNIRTNLMKHINTLHSSSKPYDCDDCGEKFVSSVTLRYHKNKVHSSIFYFCQICGKSFKWKAELRGHMNRSHSDQKLRFQCTLCTKNYAYRKKLRHHLMSKHNIPKEMTYFKNFRYVLNDHDDFNLQTEVGFE